jgi:glycosyltransferase involved in cell wall biosynthesis
MSLSVCLVTRNEEHNMERILHSVAGVADEVIVADTGSTDGTVARAGQFGARVRPFAWQDDFAAARNYALDQATGDWVLWLNPDEELLPAGLERLPAYLAQEDALGYGLRVQDLLQADRPD